MDCITTYTTKKPMPTFKVVDETSFGTQDVNDMKACLGFPYLDNITPASMDAWDNAIRNNGCITLFDNYINDAKIVGGLRNYNKENFQLLQQGFEYTFSRSYNADQNNTITDSGATNKFNLKQDALFEFCGNQSLNGVCALVQTSMCNNCTVDSIEGTAQTKFCGCYVPRDDLSRKNNVEKKCSSMCSSGNVFKLRDIDTGVIQICNNPVCVINNISIQAQDSSIDNLSFIQACPSCQSSISSDAGSTVVTNASATNSIFANGINGVQTNGVAIVTSNTDSDGNPKVEDTPKPSGCTCIIDASIPGIGRRLGLDNPETFGQFCGENSVCIQVDNTTGEERTVPCAESLSDITMNEYSKPVPLWAWIIVFVMLIVGVLVIFTLYVDKEVIVQIPRTMNPKRGYRNY